MLSRKGAGRWIVVVYHLTHLLPFDTLIIQEKKVQP